MPRKWISLPPEFSRSGRSASRTLAVASPTEGRRATAASSARASGATRASGLTRATTGPRAGRHPEVAACREPDVGPGCRTRHTVQASETIDYSLGAPVVYEHDVDLHTRRGEDGVDAGLEPRLRTIRHDDDADPWHSTDRGPSVPSLDASMHLPPASPTRGDRAG